MILTHIIAPEEDGMTLEAVLRGPMALSGRQAREAKKAGVTVDGAPFFSNQKVRAGCTIRAELSCYEADFVSAKLPPLTILYEDEALLAVQKPALLQCHPSSSAPGGTDTLEGRVQAYLHAAAHPIHRLDAETTGIVLFAKLPYVQAHIQKQMQDGSFHKTYRAWICGVPDAQEGRIDAPIAQLAPDSFTRVVREDGQRAVSRFHVEKTLCLPESVSLVTLYPETGRTHQLRVHMAHIGCPLLGDTRYGTEASRALSLRLGVSHHQLSAVSVTFLHPLTGKACTLTCPEDFSFKPDFPPDKT